MTETVDITDEPLTTHIIDQWFASWRHHLTKQGGSMSLWKARTVDRIHEAALAGIAGQWAPVSERLPEPGSDVWVYGPAERSQREMHWTGDYWYSSELPSEPPTHWMPLPEPPPGVR